jgi:hypothetical protein
MDQDRPAEEPLRRIRQARHHRSIIGVQWQWNRIAGEIGSSGLPGNPGRFDSPPLHVENRRTLRLEKKAPA